jgi:CheY-like chemotaxis protein
MARRRKRNPDVEDQQSLERELETLATVLAWYPPGTQLNFGSPSRCPDCGDYGLVERVSHSTGVCSNHCRVCRRDWIVTLRAIRAERNRTKTRPPAGLSARTPGIGAFYQAIIETEAAPETPPSDAPTATVADPAPMRDEPTPVTDEATATPLVPVEPAAPAQPAAPASAVEPDLDLSTSSSVEPRPALRVLLVEDNPLEMELIDELLEPFTETAELTLTHVVTRLDGERATESGSFDLVLLDLDLPDSAGLTTILEWQHRVSPPLPLIGIADEADATLIREARSLGVSQVLQRAHLERLASQPDAGGRRLMRLLRKAAKSPRSGAAATQRQPTTIDVT